MHIYICIYMYVYIYIYIYIYLCARVCVCVRVCVHAHACVRTSLCAGVVVCPSRHSPRDHVELVVDIELFYPRSLYLRTKLNTFILLLFASYVSRQYVGVNNCGVLLHLFMLTRTLSYNYLKSMFLELKYEIYK